MPARESPGASGEMGVGGERAPERLAGGPPYVVGGARYFERQEEKYELDRETAGEVQVEIARRLPLFSYREGHPYSYVTTVYFDTQDRDFYRRAAVHYDDNVKIRVKEYYYPPLNGREAGGAPAGGLLEAPWVGMPDPLRAGKQHDILTHCFVELKQRHRGTVIKKRFAFPKSELKKLFDGEDVWPILLRMTPPGELRSLEKIYRELREYISTYPVAPTSVVNYRRTVYQKDESDLRVTFDDRLAVYEPPEGLYTGHAALTAEVLGAPIRQSRRVILEIKCPGEYPDWLRASLRSHPSRRLSKFTTSVRLLLRNGRNGRPEDSDGGPKS